MRTFTLSVILVAAASLAVGASQVAASPRLGFAFMRYSQPSLWTAAKKRAPHVYVGYYEVLGSPNQVQVYDVHAGPGTQPLYALSGNTAFPNGIAALAVDAAKNLYVATFANTVEVFPPGASGNVPPARTISCAIPPMNPTDPGQMAFDERGNLYVVGSSVQAIVVVPSSASGCVTATRTITGANTRLDAPAGIAISRGRIWVANTDGLVTSYKATANGNAKPIAAIRGDLTMLQGNGQTLSIAADDLGNIDVVGGAYPANTGCIVEFPPTANGNVAPQRIIDCALTWGSGQPLMGVTAVADYKSQVFWSGSLSDYNGTYGVGASTGNSISQTYGFASEIADSIAVR
jgi:hypothetical protein